MRREALQSCSASQSTPGTAQGFIWFWSEQCTRFFKASRFFIFVDMKLAAAMNGKIMPEILNVVSKGGFSSPAAASNRTIPLWIDSETSCSYSSTAMPVEGPFLRLHRLRVQGPTLSAVVPGNGSCALSVFWRGACRRSTLYGVPCKVPTSTVGRRCESWLPKPQLQTHIWQENTCLQHQLRAPCKHAGTTMWGCLTKLSSSRF